MDILPEPSPAVTPLPVFSGVPIMAKKPKSKAERVASLVDALNEVTMAPACQEARAEAVAAWARHCHLPDTAEGRAMAARDLFVALAALLQDEQPEAMGSAGLKNRDLVARLRELMAPADEGAPDDALGMLAFSVFARDGLVALQYVPEVVIGLPVDSARTLADALLTVAAEIDGRLAVVTLVGPPRRGN